MKKLFRLMAGGGLLLAALCSPAGDAHAQVSIDKSGWQVVFEDDFSDPSTLGPNSTKWSNGYYFGQETPVLNCTNNYAYNTWSNIAVHDGVADFYARDVSSAPIPFAGCNDFNYTSGAITSKFNDAAYSGCVPNGSTIAERGFLYGIFEIRCRMPKGSGRQGAFWLYGGREVDVFEFSGDTPNKYFANIHWEGTSCQTFYDKAYASDLTEDYHVYTLAWTPTSMTWFFDGREIRTDTQTDNRIPVGCEWRKLMMCIDSEIWSQNLTDFSSPFSIDYVRVYKPTNGNYATTPYMQHKAINQVDVLNWNAQASSRPNLVAYNSFSGFPSREMDTDGNKVFYRTNNGNLENLYFDNGIWKPASLDSRVSNVAGNIACSRTGSSVFYSDNAGHLFNFWYDNGWRNACLNWNVSDVLNNVVCSNQTSDVFYVNKSGGLSNFRFSNNQWYNTPINGATNVSTNEKAVATLDDLVFYKNNSNVLTYVERTNGSWNWPVQIPAIANVRNSLVLQRGAGTTGINGLRVLYIGTDSQIYNAYLENGQWVSYGLNWRINNAQSDLTVQGDNVYYKGTDGRIWNYYYYGDAWRVTPIDYNNTYGIWGGICVANDGRVFFADRDRYFANAYATPSHLINPGCNSTSVISNRVVTTTSRTKDEPGAKAATAAAAITTVTLYDVSGKLMGQLPYLQYTNAKSPLELPAGLYILKFTAADNRLVRTEKIAIVK